MFDWQLWTKKIKKKKLAQEFQSSNEKKEINQN